MTVLTTYELFVETHRFPAFYGMGALKSLHTDRSVYMAWRRRRQTAQRTDRVWFSFVRQQECLRNDLWDECRLLGVNI